VCAYAEYPAFESVPEATASAGLLVAIPPPPCVVPHLPGSANLRVADRRIVAAHCKIGKTRYLASRRPRGTVIGLSPRPGSRLANSSVVTPVVSRGSRRHH
jgi:beta-lactam-binding protein with PASTA domain